MRVLAIFTVLFAIAAGAFLYARTLPYMHDKSGFDAAYQPLEDSFYNGKDREETGHLERFDDAYRTLVKAHATARNTLERYSLTVMALCAGAILLCLRGVHRLMTPPHKWLILPVGLVAAYLTYWGVFQDVDQGYERGEVAVWHSEGPGLGAGFLAMAATMAVIVLLNGLFLLGQRFRNAAAVFSTPLAKVNLFLALELLIMLGLTVLTTVSAAYFSLIATPFWLYFYLSLIAVRAQGFADTSLTPPAPS